MGDSKLIEKAWDELLVLRQCYDAFFPAFSNLGETLTKAQESYQHQGSAWGEAYAELCVARAKYQVGLAHWDELGTAMMEAQAEYHKAVDRYETGIS